MASQFTAFCYYLNVVDPSFHAAGYFRTSEIYCNAEVNIRTRNQEECFTI